MDKIKKPFLLLLVFAVLFSNLCGCNFMGGNEMEGADLEIYNKLAKSNQKELEMKYADIFTFDWEKAYVQTDPEMEQEELDQKLGFDSGLVKYDVFWGYPMRIVFVKSEKVVYEFKFQNGYMKFGNAGGWIFPEDQVVVRSHDETVDIFLKDNN